MSWHSLLAALPYDAIGGRQEEDGMFNGTHWLMVYVRPSDSNAKDHEPVESHSGPPTSDEIAALTSIVASVLAKKP